MVMTAEIKNEIILMIILNGVKLMQFASLVNYLVNRLPFFTFAHGIIEPAHQKYIGPAIAI